MTGPDLSIDSAQDTAQAMVSALLHSDRATASDLAQEFPDPLVLALVMADLVAYTHHRWTRALGGDANDRAEGWQALMVDIEEWRSQETP